ncbi:MAG: MBL fold metallo-hydrolase [Promethearchaeota archaeon]|jgi:glyoxylase-like metal-dependent hydrolase (beta-lactamase superfamily II)
MANQFITLKSGKVNDYLHHIDPEAMGSPRMLSIFLGEFEEGSILLDCGSSLEIKKCLRYFKRNKILLSSFKYLVTSHHHFDHNGGIWKLYEELKEFNPTIKIITNSITQELLNNFHHHLTRGSRTYGDFVGIMKPIEESAFHIIDPSIKFDSNPRNLETFATFHSDGSEVHLAIFKTPGHTPDHQCPAFIREGELDFIHYGEAVGTIYHSSKLVTMPTSMPIYYNHEKYMETLGNIKRLAPLKAGFGHFGMIHEKENIRRLVSEHESFMIKFRENIIKYYKEKPETKYVLKKMMPLMTLRTDLPIDLIPVFESMILAVIYGEMISLGYRDIPDDDLVYYKKFYAL